MKILTVSHRCVYQIYNKIRYCFDRNLSAITAYLKLYFLSQFRKRQITKKLKEKLSKHFLFQEVAGTVDSVPRQTHTSLSLSISI